MTARTTSARQRAKQRRAARQGGGVAASRPGRVAAVVSRFGRAVMTHLVRLYYPRIDVSGAERLPAQGPVLYVANHANSLIDPIIITIAARRTVHFLAKAPLFEMPIVGRLMRALGMIPAYRGVDSRAQVKRNLESLDAAASLLAQDCAVGLFPEGKSHDALHVDQVRTGASRIALQAMARGATGLHIVPLGINYEQKERFRSAVWVQAGEPIDLAAWRAERLRSARDAETNEKADGESAGDADDRRLGRALTEEIAQRLRAAVIHLDDPQLEPLLNDVEVLLPGFDEQRRTPAGALQLRKQVADAINHYLAADPERAGPLVEAVSDHHERVESAGLTIRSPVMRYRGLALAGLLVMKSLQLLIGIVPMLAGTVHHLVPFVVVRVIASRFQQPGRMTIALWRLLFGLPVYGGWYALVWWLMAQQYPLWVAWTWFGVMPAAGVFALSYWKRAHDAAELWWHQIRALVQRERLEQLRREREHVMKSIGELASEFVQSRAAAA